MKSKRFVDSTFKIITECPKCSNQHTLYLIKCNSLIDGLQTQWCENCNLPYVLDVETELICKAKTYGCKENNDEK